MTAETIAKALGARRAGVGWMARCPAHDDRLPSLSICDTDDGRVLVHCHAGCEQQQVISALKALGVWGGAIDRRSPPVRGSVRPAMLRQSGRDDPARTAAALSIWQASIPARQTTVETYLEGRGLGLTSATPLRSHPALKHPSGGVWPAMVALVTRGWDDTPVGIHRTFLARDGLGKAPVEPARMMLGPCRGGAVKLGAPGDTLMVGEGLETCLAAIQSTGPPAWAALSTSGLRTLDLPGDVKNVLVLADGDPAGEAAARFCARRWTREGRRVRIARPPPGLDFNDLLMGKRPKLEDAP